MASFDPTLSALAIFSAYKLYKSYKKTTKANGEVIMTEKNTSISKSFTITTLYNAMCGVLGNVIWSQGEQLPALDI